MAQRVQAFRARFAEEAMLGMKLKHAQLAEHLEGVDTSAGVKEAVRKAFITCDRELLEHCKARDWADGCCLCGVLLDLLCSPPRAYVANLGDSRCALVRADGPLPP